MGNGRRRGRQGRRALPGAASPALGPWRGRLGDRAGGQGVPPRVFVTPRVPVSLPIVLRVIVPGLFLRRQAYLRMVLARDGVGDAVILVAATYLLLALPQILVWAGLLAVVRLVLGGVFGWIVLSGFTYLAGKHILHGDGTFPSVMAASGLAFPPLLVSLALRPFLPHFLALVVASAWMLACLWQATRVSLSLSPARAAVAAAGGYGGWMLLSALSVL
jgi:hypothetical protein